MPRSRLVEKLGWVGSIDVSCQKTTYYVCTRSSGEFLFLSGRLVLAKGAFQAALRSDNHFFYLNPFVSKRFEGIQEENLNVNTKPSTLIKKVLLLINIVGEYNEAADSSISGIDPSNRAGPAWRWLLLEYKQKLLLFHILHICQ